MDMDFKKLKVKIINKSDPAQDGTGCRLWRGALEHKGNATYGKMNVKMLGQWRVMHVHRVAYMAEYEIIISQNMGDVSHLCHNTLCVNVKHMAVEPHSTNMDRSICKSMNLCRGHIPFKNCMF